MLPVPIWAMGRTAGIAFLLIQCTLSHRCGASWPLLFKASASVAHHINFEAQNGLMLQKVSEGVPAALQVCHLSSTPTVSTPTHRDIHLKYLVLYAELLQGPWYQCDQMENVRD